MSLGPALSILRFLWDAVWKWKSMSLLRPEQPLEQFNQSQLTMHLLHSRIFCPNRFVMMLVRERRRVSAICGRDTASRRFPCLCWW